MNTFVPTDLFLRTVTNRTFWHKAYGILNKAIEKIRGVNRLLV